MNKQLISLMLFLALLLTAAGCAAAGQKLDTAWDRAEEKLDTVEDSIEQSFRRTLTPAAADGSATADPVTREKAEQIALNYLGLTRDQVKRLHTEYEIDNGVGQYDVSFTSGDFEYEFEIHGETGQILSYDRDHKYD